ncbi:hypothetical protein ACFLS9_03010 [Bacteroidota bacterium]
MELRAILKNDEVIILNEIIKYAKENIKGFDLNMKNFVLLIEHIDKEVEKLKQKAKEAIYDKKRPIYFTLNFMSQSYVDELHLDPYEIKDYKYKDGIPKEVQDENYNEIRRLIVFRMFLLDKIYPEIELAENLQSLKKDDNKKDRLKVPAEEFVNFYIKACKGLNNFQPSYAKLEEYAELIKYKSLSKSTISNRLNDPHILALLLKKIQKKLKMAKIDEKIVFWQESYMVINDKLTEIQSKRDHRLEKYNDNKHYSDKDNDEDKDEDMDDIFSEVN